jgi:glyoxylase-like metal-dependent hydrolase (beta-lactamase superfamily II)
MKLTVLETGRFKLDGGAMFGVVPKSIWHKLNPADSNNMCTWAMRCLLVEDGDRLILIDTGIGDKQSDKFFGYYLLSGDNSIVSAITKAGYTPNEVTDVILTHLHFDHVGGAVQYNRAKEFYEPTFPNATYHTHIKHWDHANNPNPREKASFLVENFACLESSGQLHFSDELSSIGNHVTLSVVNGHTESMFIPRIQAGEDIIYYCADLIPSKGHMKVNYVMAYDIEPLKSMEERYNFLEHAYGENARLFFEHDPETTAVSITRNNRNQVVIGEEFRF